MKQHIFVKQMHALLLCMLLAGLFGMWSAVLPVSAAPATAWEIVTVDSEGDVGSRPSIALKPNANMPGGQPFVSYYDFSHGHLREALYMGPQLGGCLNGWHCYQADDLPQTGKYSSLAFDANGNGIVGYTNEQGEDTVYQHIVPPDNDTITSNKLWAKGYIDGDTGVQKRFVTVGIKKGTVPMVAFYNYEDNADFDKSFTSLRYIDPQVPETKSTIIFRYDDLGKPLTLGYSASLGRDEVSQKTAIAFRGQGSALVPLADTLNYASETSGGGTCNNSNWNCDLIDTTPETGNAISLYEPKHAGEDAQISYYDATHHTLKYARHVGGNVYCGVTGLSLVGWTCENIETVGSDNGMLGTSLTLVNGTPTIAYTDRDDHGNSVLKVARPVASGGNCGMNASAGKWNCTALDNGLTPFQQPHDVGLFPSIAASTDGRAHIAYYDATSGDLKVAIEKAIQTITFDPLPNKVTSDAPFTVHATAFSKLPVSFSASGVCSVSGTTVTLTKQTGNCTITAHQNGNNQWHSASDVSQTFAVTVVISYQLPQTIAFDPLPDHMLMQAPFSVSATASSGLPVSFVSSTPAVCTVSGSTVTLVSVGTCTLVAQQAGDSTYKAAPDVAQSFAVTKHDQSISFDPCRISTSVTRLSPLRPAPRPACQSASQPAACVS